MHGRGFLPFWLGFRWATPLASTGRANVCGIDGGFALVNFGGAFGSVWVEAFAEGLVSPALYRDWSVARDNGSRGLCSFLLFSFFFEFEGLGVIE
jgi:hypothetical protein